MNNWFLLLFAVLCIFQPTSSEGNLVHGGDSRCVQRPNPSYRQSRQLLEYRLSTPILKTRRTNILERDLVIREEREDENARFSSHRHRELKNERNAALLTPDLRNTERLTRYDRSSVDSRRNVDSEMSERNIRLTRSRTNARRLFLLNDNRESKHRDIREEKIRPSIRTNIANVRDNRIIRSRDNARNRIYERNFYNERNSFSKIVTKQAAKEITRSSNERQTENRLNERFNAGRHNYVNNIRRHREYDHETNIKLDESRAHRREMGATVRNDFDRRSSVTFKERSSNPITPLNQRLDQLNERRNTRDQEVSSRIAEKQKNSNEVGNDIRGNHFRRTTIDMKRGSNDGRKIQNNNRIKFDNRFGREDFQFNGRDVDRQMLNRNIRNIARDSNVRLSNARVRINTLSENVKENEINVRKRSLDRTLSRQVRAIDSNRRITERNVRETSAIRNERRESFQQNLRRLRPQTRIISIVDRNTDREHMERGSSRRLRLVRSNDRGNNRDEMEQIRVGWHMSHRQGKVGTKDVNFSNVEHSYRTYNFFDAVQAKTQNASILFGFEIQNLFYFLNAIYLLGLLKKFQIKKEGFEKKTSIGSWKNSLLKVD